jgi:hypothetical protein
LVHRRLWPALVRVAERFPKNRLAQVHQEHTASGRHKNREVPFPKWVPLEVTERARVISEGKALGALGPWTALPEPKSKRPAAGTSSRWSR